MSKEPWRIESRQKIADGLETICRDNAFHPVKDYLEGRKWDGVSRLDTLFIDYLGTEDTELNRRITRLVFTAAVYRAYEPGTKFDQIVVLVGTQGCGKSTILEKMAVRRSWFSSSMPSPDKPEDAAKHLRGKFIIEIGELVGFRKAEVEAIKNFLSKRLTISTPLTERMTCIDLDRMSFSLRRTRASSFVMPPGRGDTGLSGWR